MSEEMRRETVEHARVSAQLFKRNQVVYSYQRGFRKCYGWCSVDAWPSQSKMGCLPVGQVKYDPLRKATTSEVITNV